VAGRAGAERRGRPPKRQQRPAHDGPRLESVTATGARNGHPPACQSGCGGRLVSGFVLGLGARGRCRPRAQEAGARAERDPGLDSREPTPPETRRRSSPTSPAGSGFVDDVTPDQPLQRPSEDPRRPGSPARRCWRHGSAQRNRVGAWVPDRHTRRAAVTCATSSREPIRPMLDVTPVSGRCSAGDVAGERGNRLSLDVARRRDKEEGVPEADPFFWGAHRVHAFIPQIAELVCHRCGTLTQTPLGAERETMPFCDCGGHARSSASSTRVRRHANDPQALAAAAPAAALGSSRLAPLSPLPTARE
jgi:hypothetical protein